MSTISSANNREQTRAGGASTQDASVLDRAKEVASKAADKVTDAATAVSKRADQLAATAGSNVRSVGETIKERGPHEGMLGDATRSVAGTIEAGGKYIEEQGVSGMVEDVAGVIKRNPVPSILVGVGLGILIGRALRS